ncbi:cell division protein ZipA [Thioalkalivibrio sp. AKL17]|uniref:cell division protein ZipA n=1 Tax=Thioalkalivibrio sp. AKL17 TaxID=1158160 RepID=UPI000374B0AF|nr:cell division protein ZipA [Thioalkalivibrio sp. AKL17]
MDWMRLSLLLLGIVLIAGIWITHRMRTRARERDEADDAGDWADDAVHIRAGAPDPLDEGPRVTGGRREPHLGVTSPGPDAEPDPDDPFEAAPRGSASAQEPVNDIYGVLEDEEPGAGAGAGAGAADHGASGPRGFETDYGGDLRAAPEPEPQPESGRRAAPGRQRRRSAKPSPGERLIAVGRQGLDAVRARMPGPGRKSRGPVGERLDPDHEVDPDLIEEPDRPDPESLGEYVSDPWKAGENPRAASASLQEKILLLHVVAPRNKPFTGVALGAALERAGLKPGAMDIYHYHEPESDKRQPLFSVANMVAPGTLRDEDLADMMTPGVTLFTQVHYSAHPQRAFEALLENAHALARDLGGTILDAQQSTATNQTLAHMREDLNQWLLRNRPDILRRGRTQ